MNIPFCETCLCKVSLNNDKLHFVLLFIMPCSALIVHHYFTQIDCQTTNVCVFLLKMVIWCAKDVSFF